MDKQEDGSLVGRDLDVAVAERIFGRKLRVCDEEMIYARGDVERWVYKGEKYIYEERDGLQPEEVIPYYSTDIAAAMTILDKADGMWTLERYVERDEKGGDTYLQFKCYLRFGDNLATSWSNSSPAEAICRAALKAVGSAALATVGEGKK